MRIARSLVGAGVEVHVVAFAPPSDRDMVVAPVQASEGYRLYRAPTDPKDPTGFVRYLERLDRMVRFDLFHAFFLHMAALCLDVAARGQRPVVASMRGFETLLLANKSYRAMMAQVLRKVTWVTYLSSDGLAAMNQLFDCTEKSSFIANAIDKRGLGSWALGEHNRGVVGTVATFRAKKRIPLLIDAYAALPRERRKRLLLVGDITGPTGPQTKIAMDESARRSGIEVEIEITGYVPRPTVAARLLDMNVFVLSSVQEGLPNAILEAAASGVPIVSTAVDGVKDVFTHEQSALLVPPEDQSALTAAIKRVLDDDALAARLSAGALQLSKALTLEFERQAWLDLYRRLAAQDTQTVQGAHAG